MIYTEKQRKIYNKIKTGKNTVEKLMRYMNVGELMMILSDLQILGYIKETKFGVFNIIKED